MRDFIILACLAAFTMNIGGFFTMLWDKSQARNGGRRVSEANLITISLLGGSIGTVAGALYARHKTRKQPIATILLSIPFIQAFFVIVWWMDWWPTAG